MPHNTLHLEGVVWRSGCIARLHRVTLPQRLEEIQLFSFSWCVKSCDIPDFNFVVFFCMSLVTRHQRDLDVSGRLAMSREVIAWEPNVLGVAI